MMQWSEGVGMDPSRPLVPVIKRSLTHDEKIAIQALRSIPVARNLIALNCT